MHIWHCMLCVLSALSVVQVELWCLTTAVVPDVTTFTYDESSGYYHDALTGYYYDSGTQVLYSRHMMVWWKTGYRKTSTIIRTFFTIKLLWKLGVRIIHRSSYFTSLFQIETIVENETVTLLPCLEDHSRRSVCVRPRLIFVVCCSPPIIWTKPTPPSCLLLCPPQLVRLTHVQF